MRDLTDDEKSLLYKQGLCPFCGGDEFYEGPHGASAINWYCANELCLAGFNLMIPGLWMGQLIRDSNLSLREGTSTLTGPRLPEDSLRELFKRKTTLRAWLAMLESYSTGG